MKTKSCVVALFAPEAQTVEHSNTLGVVFVTFLIPQVAAMPDFFTFPQIIVMIVTIVHVCVKPAHVEDFVNATKENHLHSLREKGNFRFDVLAEDSVPGKFILYEAYESQEYIDAHRNTPHYLKWRDTVAPWMEKPREGIRHTMIFPAQ